MMVMMTRTGRCFGHAPRYQNGCGDHRDRHARPNEKPPRRLLRVQHIESPLNSIAAPAVSESYDL
jgi:hypothetical protein